MIEYSKRFVIQILVFTFIFLFPATFSPLNDSPAVLEVSVPSPSTKEPTKELEMSSRVLRQRAMELLEDDNLYIVEKVEKVEEIPEVEVKKVKAVPVISRGEERPVIDENDLYWLSCVVSAESRGESVEGQIAVANVVLNRARDRKKSIKQIIFEKNQFCVVRTGTVYNEPTKQAVDSALRALSGEKIVPDNTYFFYNPKTATSKWIKSRPIFKHIGNHVFAGE